MTFKTCTRRIQRAHDFRQQQTEQARKQFQNSLHGTRLPYPGPNFQNTCMPKCMSVYNEKDADRKMNKILRMYEEANRKDSSLRERKPKSSKYSNCRKEEKSRKMSVG